jgi:hypothetical protein
MVEEGLLITLSAVRMGVKNDIIVGALGEHTDYDRAQYAEAAKAKLLEAARQCDQYAARAAWRKKNLASQRWSVDFSEDQRGDLRQYKLQKKVQTLLAEGIREVAADDEQVREIVESAQIDASDEINEAVSAKLVRLAVDPNDPEYEERREERTNMFVHVDLALLMAKQAKARGEDDNEY